MKIGFVVHFFDFRNDVRRVIEEVAKRYQVVLFARPADVANMQALVPPGVELRIFQERKTTLSNRAWEQLFRLCGRLPESRKNYYLMEVFKISLLKSVQARRKASRMLQISMKLPHFFRYDDYLDKLSYTGLTPIADIDQFILFTEISDDYLFARLVRENKPLKVYVYSWDHPCKQKRYSQRAHYLVWNEGLKQDMVDLQGVAAERITITGASQFGYVKQFREIANHEGHNPFPFSYIYFGCAIGAPEMAIREVEVIRRISQLMMRATPDLKLVVRPYPVLKDWDAVCRLPETCSNVVMDSHYKQKGLVIADSVIMDKFLRMYHAQAFLHMGTTLGFEACFTDTPSVLIDFADLAKEKRALSLYSFVHQYQNEKYLMPAGSYPNVVRDENELVSLLKKAATSKSELLAYNQAVRQTTQLTSFEAFAANLISKPVAVTLAS